MNLQVPQQVGNYLTSWRTTSFSRRTQFHWVSLLVNHVTDHHKTNHHKAVMYIISTHLLTSMVNSFIWKLYLPLLWAHLSY